MGAVSGFSVEGSVVFLLDFLVFEELGDSVVPSLADSLAGDFSALVSDF